MRHVPKKLTDCPENLRESIDWLIQVRYGNGEGDKGLGELAKALKKLIEEAIGNATTSFEKREKELQCPDNPSAESSYCRSKEKEIKKLKESKSSDNSNLSKLESDLQKHKDADHYMIKEDRDKELKDIDTRRISLGQLAGQLGSFIGGEGKVSEAIKKALDILNKQLKKCENSKNHHASHDCQDPSNCQSIQQKIDALKQFDIANKNKHNNPTNILTNLCSGLEKFLGFNSDSKGYDGTGIVYSDLDRLCDGVMGFLSGVLGAVKNENEVTTYDKYITTPNKKLNDVLDIVTNNIGSGRTGLAASVAEVKGWLEGYEGELKRRTNNVIGELGKLIHDKIDGYGKYIVSGSADKKLQDQLAAWTSVLGSISDALQTVETNVNMLDDKLKSDVMHEISVIHSSVAMLKQSAGDNDLIQAVSETVKKFDATRKEAEEAVTNEARKVDDALKKQIAELVKNSEAYIEETKRVVITDVNAILDAAQKDAEWQINMLDAEYKHRIEAAYKRLNEAMKALEISAISQNAVFRAMDDLEKAFEKLQGNSDPNSKGLVDDAEQEIKYALQQLVTHASKLNTNIEDEIKGPLQSWIYSNETNGLREHDQLVSKGVQSFRTHYTTIHEKLGEIKNVVQALGSPYGVGGQSVLDSYVSGIRDNISSIPKAIIVDLQNKIVQELEKLNNHPSSVASKPYLQKYLSFIGSVFEAATKATESTTTQKGEEVKTVFANVTIKVDELMMNYNEELGKLNSMMESANREITNLNKFSTATNAPDGTLKPLMETLTSNMNILTKGINNVIQVVNGANDRLKNTVKCADNLEKMLRNEYESGFGRKFRELKQQVKLLSLDTMKKALQEAVEGVNAQIEALKKVPDDVDSGANSADKRRGKLKGRIAELKEEIKQHIAGRTQALNITVNSALTNAQMEAEALINKLSDEYKQRLKEGIDALEQQVQKMFAEQHKTDLESLKTLVMRQEERIGRIFSDDQKTNLKGLLHLCNVKLPLLNKPDFPFLVSRFQHFYNQTHRYVKYQLDGVDDADPDSQPETPDPLAALLLGLTGKVDKLLSKLERSEHFDYEFRRNLDALECALQAFMPFKFGGPCTVLLDVVKGGVTQMAGELDKAYVSRYSGQRITWTETKEDKSDVPSHRATKCAKAFLSAIPMLHNDLRYLKDQCNNGSWKFKQIYTTSDEKTLNPLGDFLSSRGYTVSTGSSKQDGVLRNNEGKKGYKLFEGVRHLFSVNDEGALQKLNKYLHRYFEVCHASTFNSKRHPCSVYEMLLWYTGLPYNSVYVDFMADSFSTLFDKPEKKDSDETKTGEFTIEVLDNQSLKAYPRDVRYGDLHQAVTHITSYSYELLTTIAGFGDEYSGYACDYSNNSLKFYYPSKADDCLHMFVDIYSRLLQPLLFLESQCKLATRHNGWRDCQYGKEIPTTKSHCIKQPETEPTDQPTSQPKCQANSKVNCQPTSPLMSYLNDCLPGHLPHDISSIGCGSKCATCPKNLPGMPCLTPLGFRGFSGQTKTGKELCEMIGYFLDDDSLATLFCILPRPPSTLSQHFGFVLSLVYEWQKSGSHPLRQWVRSSIGETSINLETSGLELTDALKYAYGADYHCHTYTKHCDVMSLTTLGTCKTDGQDYQCAPYLSAVCSDMYKLLAKKHCGLYLSWAVYLPWNFWSYLNNLYNDFLQIFCQDWGCRRCLNSDSCRRGKHGDEQHPCNCFTMVNCRGVSPTLYKHGFIFGDSRELNDLNHPRRCSDFASQLQKVVKSELFTKLFNQCDNFLYQIRFPFMTLILALWLLSLLYLVHIMIIRLDLLHIKSHLHSPSSHRIAAQSLLAAGRVNKLNRVFYLQP